MRHGTKAIIGVLSLLALISAAAPLSAQERVNFTVLCDGEWHSDEFSFHFYIDRSFKAFQTQGDTLGTVKGSWKEIAATGAIELTKDSVEGSFFDTVFAENVLRLTFIRDPSNPKSTESLYGLGGKLVVWHDKAWVPADKAVSIGEGKIAAVTTGYRLTATTQNLRLREGPGTGHAYRIWSYLDAATGTVKTFTSVYAGTNLRILARTAEKEKVGDWYNYWYYVEYKEPLDGYLVYRNAWMFGEFLNVVENKGRAVTIVYPENEGDYYSDYELEINGTVTGAPVSVKLQVKSGYGAALSTVPADFYSQEEGIFRHMLSKSGENLFIGSNTVSVIATYSDGKASVKQITFYLHESVGERAKPVIYLYPTRETDVTVRVSPLGGVTVSEPAYGSGWTVRAKPDGTITDKADGKVYPYLFWESKETAPPMPTKGFVIARAELPDFFRDKLSLLGLNAKETADFLEFWIPVLTEGPWYLVSFADQAELDAAVPLEVSPRPDSVIRVFFDARPLAAPIAIDGQVLAPRSRTGFAVIEWGGMRYGH